MEKGIGIKVSLSGPTASFPRSFSLCSVQLHFSIGDPQCSCYPSSTVQADSSVCVGMSRCRCSYVRAGVNKNAYEVRLENVYHRRKVCGEQLLDLHCFLVGRGEAEVEVECNFSMAVHVRFEARRQDAGVGDNAGG